MTVKKFLIVTLALLLLPQILTSLPKASADSTLSQNLSKIKVDRVVHTVELLEGGLIVINDTVTVSTLNPDETISVDFPIGFPYDFAPYLVKCFATTSDNKVIPIIQDYGLGMPGFYGVLLELTDIENGLNIDYTPKNFTVTFIFSGPITVEDNSLTMNFTLFPSLAIDGQLCNTTVIFPTGLSFSEASFTYNTTRTSDNKNYYYLNATSLEKFAYDRAKAWLRLSISEGFTYAEVEKLVREIEVDVYGNINVKDTYYIVNKGASSITSITVYFPKDGYDFIVENMIGIKILDVKKADLENNRLNIPNVEPNKKTAFSLVYRLNSTAILSRVNSDFKLNISIGKITPLLIKELIVRFTPFQGNRIKLSTTIASLANSIKRDLLKDSIEFTFNYYTLFDKFQTEIIYEPNIFWTSYPYVSIALVAGALILLGGFIWKKPSPVPVAVPKVTVSPKIFRKFVEGYEERIKIISRIERLEEQARKGRISRRQYKVRKKMLENKLSSLSKDLADLKERIRHSGPRYADIIRQLEIAEAQLEEAEAGIRRVRSRYRRGEISREAYRRLLEGHEKRIEEANVIIEGALLRLKEEYR